MINFQGEHTCASDAHLLLSQFCMRLKGKAMRKLLINYEDLVALGFKTNQARTIIRNAKKLMAKKGYPFYNGKRVGSVPAYAVSEITGLSFSDKTEGGNK